MANASLAGSSLTPRFLRVCESVFDACQGAANQERTGMAVEARSLSDGVRLQWATMTPLGPTERSGDFDTDFIDGMVRETLKAGERDVWLACDDMSLVGLLSRTAEGIGARVETVVPSGRLANGDPFAVFRQLRRPAPPSASGWVASFCELDPSTHAPMGVGNVLRMASEVLECGRTEVGYIDENGWLVGLHGRMGSRLTDAERLRLDSVRVKVTGESWGRNWLCSELRPVQTLLFDIPCDIEAMLRDCKLPPRRAPARGGGETGEDAGEAERLSPEAAGTLRRELTSENMPHACDTSRTT